MPKIMPSYARYALSALAAVILLSLLACTGAQGGIGASGSLGPQGPEGEQGSPGLSGAQGGIGASGSLGPQGPDGEQGSEGPAGQAGLSAQLQPIQEQVVGLQDQLIQLLTRAFVNPNGGTSSLFEHRGAYFYTVLGPPVFAGPPVEENGLTTVAGIVEIETNGTAVGHAVIDFTCVVGANGASNQCQGIESFEGTFNGKAGSYKTNLEWTAAGDAAFTAGVFELVSGSGTGELEDLVKWEGVFQRDETAGLNGIVFGVFRFDQ